MAVEHQNLSGKILLAHPTLHDANFRRTIIYIVSHDQETGTLGFIINRPAHRSFAHLDLGELPESLVNSRIYLGGPVCPQNVILATLGWNPAEQKMTFQHFTEDVEDLTLDPERTIAILGYSGWSEGQLERELGENSWIVIEPEHDLLEADAATWKKLIRENYPHLRLLVELPDDPSLN